MISPKKTTKKTAVIGRGEGKLGEEIYAAAGVAAFPDDAPLFQTGKCVPCKIALKSWSKEATCPRCGKKVWLT